jgi:hypothetical protein
MPRRPKQVPEAIVQLQEQLNQWRSVQQGRTKLPDLFWQSAVELAKRYGVYRTAHALRLDYMRLKKQLGESAGPHPLRPQASFVELRPIPSITAAMHGLQSGCSAGNGEDR